MASCDLTRTLALVAFASCLLLNLQSILGSRNTRVMSVAPQSSPMPVPVITTNPEPVREKPVLVPTASRNTQQTVRVLNTDPRSCTKALIRRKSHPEPSKPVCATSCSHSTSFAALPSSSNPRLKNRIPCWYRLRRAISVTLTLTEEFVNVISFVMPRERDGDGNTNAPVDITWPLMMGRTYGKKHFAPPRIKS